MKARDEAREVIREAITKWNEVYALALQVGPHNPDGSTQRAEELTRTYMSGMLMGEEARRRTS